MRRSLRTLQFLALTTVAACGSSSTWKAEPFRGPFKAYGDNLDFWRGSAKWQEVRVPTAREPRELHSGWKTRTRTVHADDKLPGLSKSQTGERVGKPLVGLDHDGEAVIPPMFRSIHPLDSEHAMVLVYEPEPNVESVQFVDFETGKLTPALVGGKPLEDWLYVASQIPTAAELEQGVPPLAFALAPDGPDTMRFGIFDASGNTVFGTHGLKRAAEDADFTILLDTKTIFLSTRDANDRPMVLAFDEHGRPLDLVLPAIEQLARVEVGAEWFKKSDYKLPPATNELAIAIGEIEGEQLEDPRLYLPFGSDERPLMLPEGSLGMVRLVAYSNEKSSKLYMNFGEAYGQKTPYPNCHSGWAIVREDANGLVFEVGGGTAEQVVGASLAGHLPRYRHFWSHSLPRQLYNWTGNVGVDGKERTFRAVTPARAIGQRIDGNYEAIDLHRGSVCDLFFGETDYRNSIENLEIDVKNTDAMLVNTVSSHAVEQYEIQADMQRQAALQRQRDREEAERLLALQRAELAKATQAEFVVVAPKIRELLKSRNSDSAKAALQACKYDQAELWREYYYRYGASFPTDVRHAAAMGMPSSWIAERDAAFAASDARAAAHEAGIDPNYEVFSWDGVFSAWHIQNRSRNSRVEVIHDRGLTKIIRYD